MVTDWIANIENYDIPDQDYSYVSDFLLIWAYTEHKLISQFQGILQNPQASLGCNVFRKILRDIDVEINEDISGSYSFFQNRYTGQEGPRYFEGLFPPNRNHQYRDNTQRILNEEAPPDSSKILVLSFICSRLRNNLFHGAKDLPLIAEQKDVLEHGTLGIKGLVRSISGF